ncbi:hypothetical protein HZA41_00280 [Candidatus Peregrinibacteria bacterium]|nr:hypothetical protein [Candidatus Peregrinibacteria bacterium]
MPDPESVRELPPGLNSGESSLLARVFGRIRDLVYRVDAVFQKTVGIPPREISCDTKDCNNPHCCHVDGASSASGIEPAAH